MSPARSWAALGLLLLAGCAPPRRTLTQLPESANDWFNAPCLPDNSDDFDWTRYSLHGIRIRVPRGTQEVKVPDQDELMFRAGSATLFLRLNVTANRLYAQYNMPDRVHRFCTDDIGGWIADAISFRRGAGYGFASLWADADRGEWLTAVVEANTLSEVTWLRRALFTIEFPGERIR